MRLFGAALLLASAASVALAQSHRADYESENKFGSYEAAPGMGAAVLNAPFSAEAITIWRPTRPSEQSEWRGSARFYRDSGGRVRVEQTFVGHADDRNPERIVIALDPNSPTVFVIDSAARTVSEYPRPIARNTVGGYGRLVLPLSMTRFVTFMRPQLWRAYNNAEGEDESLGEKAILGIPVTGTSAHITLPIGAFQKNHEIQIVDERWISKELQLLMYSRTDDSEYGTLEHQVTRVSRSEPPAELFEIPAGYSPIPTKYPVSFPNPYIPRPWPDERVGRK